MEKDFSIKTEREKADRKLKISDFVDQYGNGKKGLTEEQKKERIKKVLGNESSKLNLFNDGGVELYKIDGKPLPKNISDNLKNYPLDPNSIDHESRILDINVEDDGTLTMSGIIINGKENSIAERGVWGQESISDEEAARSEKRQAENKLLKEVSDRTMAIHEENGDLNALFEDPNIDTGEDKPNQY